MRTMLALLTACALSAGLAACGGAGADMHARTATAAVNATAPTPRALAQSGYLKSDGDDDPDDRGKGASRDDQQELIAASSRGASPADRRAIAVAVRRYYAAALAANGARGCALLERNLAVAIAADRSVAAHGSTCAAALSRLFMTQHKYLASEDPKTMTITGVRVKGDAALATFGFRTMPEGELILQRKGRHWKLDALFDSGLP